MKINKNVIMSDDFFKLPIAHRGLHSKTVAENSIKAFELAKNHNFAIEIDIHKLKSGEFAVFHDQNLKRMTGEDLNISTLSANKLKNFKLFDGQNIPLLTDVLNLVDGQVPLLIELKPEDGFDKKDLPALFKILDKYNHPEMVAIQSFNPFIIKAVKKQKPTIFAGILASYKLKHIKGIKNFVARSLLLFSYTKADFISYDINFLPNKYVARKKKKGIPVFAWVVKDNNQLKLSKTVADNIIFENMEIFENDKSNK